MGIDAEMLVRRVKAEYVTDEWLKELSWRLVEAIGEKKFFISDGLPPAEYEVAIKTWSAAFDSHPLYAEWDRLRNPPRSAQDPFGFAISEQDRKRADDMRAQILGDIGERPEMRRLAIDRTLVKYREDDDPLPGSEYREDSDKPIKASPGECLLELSLMGRYYGPDYERGDIIAYCAIAEWLEANIPGCEVWYGGDSSGVLAQPFREPERRKLREHLYKPNGRAYFNFGGSMMGNSAAKPAACSLCPGGKYWGSQCGWGGNSQYAGFHCRGCGKSIETRDGGKTWAVPKETF